VGMMPTVFSEGSASGQGPRSGRFPGQPFRSTSRRRLLESRLIIEGVRRKLIKTVRGPIECSINH
jgi:hypothetical protein